MKILYILQELSNKELEEFSIFLNSPFFKASKNAVSLYKIIYQQLKKQSNQEIDTQKVFRRFFPKNESVDLKKIGKIAFELRTLLDEYLSIKQLRKAPIISKRLQANAFKEKGLTRFFERTQTKGISILEKNQNRDFNFHLNNFLIHQDIFLHPDTFKFSSEVDSLKKANQHLDLFFSMTKLRLGIEITLRKKWANDSSEVFLLEEIKNQVNQDASPILKMYVQMLELVENTSFDKKSFDTIFKSFKKNLSLLPHTENILFYYFLLNYVTAFINKGEHQYFPKQLNLYEFGIKEKLLMENNNRMTDATFINIVQTYNFLNKKEKAESFIKNYQKYLAKETQASAVLFSKAYLAFGKKKFDDCIRYIEKAAERSTHYKFKSRSLYIRCFYERFVKDKVRYKRFLKSELTNYTQYFNRLKLLSADRKTLYQNLGKTIRQLAEIQIFPEGKQRTTRLKKLEKFLEQNNMVAKTWVNQKITEL